MFKTVKKSIITFSMCLMVIGMFLVSINIKVNADTNDNVVYQNKYFKAMKISDRITRIDDAAKSIMYLVEGDDRAVLIDTGVGLGDLKEVVDNLTDKPVTVLLTHGHEDHIMGAAAFDDVYMNPQDNEVFKENTDREALEKYIKDSATISLDEIKEEDIKYPMDLNKIKPLNEGDVFSLGGVTLEIYRAAGHTPGSVAVLDREERTLFLGDACNTVTLLTFDYSYSIGQYKGSLKQLKEKTDGLYDKVYLFHPAKKIGDNVISEVDPKIIDTVLGLCDEVLNGTADNLKVEDIFGNQAYFAKTVVSRDDNSRVDGIEGNILYSRVRD